MERTYMRGNRFYMPDNEHILIIGCGHVGSNIAIVAAKMGVKEITVVDPDVVEPHNLPNQFFVETIKESTLKVSSLKETIQKLGLKTKINPLAMRIEDAIDAGLIQLDGYAGVFVCVDNMETRTFLHNKTYNCLMVDIRTAGELCNIYAVMPPPYTSHHATASYYERSLYRDDEVPDVPCDAAANMDLSMIFSGHALSLWRHCMRYTMVHQHVGLIYHIFVDVSTHQSWVMAHIAKESNTTQLAEQVAREIKQAEMEDDSKG